MIRISLGFGEEEKEVEKKTKEYCPLKSAEAENLRQQGKIVVEGIEVNLWQKHSTDTVADNAWNDVKSYAELNAQTDGKLGKVVISGTMQIPRSEASEIASNLGFKVHSNVSKLTDFMVIGTRNVSPSKIAKALKLNENGADIKFVDVNTCLEVLAENMN